jgi:hypothetical protein
MQSPANNPGNVRIIYPDVMCPLVTLLKILVPSPLKHVDSHVPDDGGAFGILLPVQVLHDESSTGIVRDVVLRNIHPVLALHIAHHRTHVSCIRDIHAQHVCMPYIHR